MVKQHNKAFLEWAHKYIRQHRQWFSAHELLGEYVTSSGRVGGTKRYIGNASAIGSALRSDSRFTSTKQKGITVYKVIGLDIK